MLATLSAHLNSCPTQAAAFVRQQGCALPRPLHQHWSALPGAAEGALLSPGACDVAGPGRMLLQQALSQHGPFCVSGRQASSSKLSVVPESWIQ